MAKTYSKLGDSLVGKHLIGISRKIHQFKQDYFLIDENKEYHKIKRHGGIKAKAINKKEIDYFDLLKLKNRLWIDLHGELDDEIEGNLILCECETSKPLGRGKKISGLSARHSGMGYDFKGNVCLSFISEEFTQSKSIALTGHLEPTELLKGENRET